MESPYMGWTVPHEWQEPDYGDDFEPETDDETDADGYLITEM